MGEWAERMLTGRDCQCCGQPLLKDHGYAVSCTECDGEAKLFIDATNKERKKEGWVKHGE